MKIRTGFVSNSSSSSFIVAGNTSAPCPHCGRSDNDIDFCMDILERTEHYGGGDTGIEATGKEEIIEYIKENYLCPGESIEDDEFIYEKYKKVLKIAEENSKIYLITLDYSDEELITSLFANLKFEEF